MLLNIAEKGRFIVVEGLADVFGVGVGLVYYQSLAPLELLIRAYTDPIKEATSLPQDPAPFGKLDFTLFQGLVAIIQGSNPLLKTLTAFGQLVNLRGERGS